MRSPVSTNPPQVHRSFAAGKPTPTEAAARLARLEFDVARLEREIASSERRAMRARRTLAQHAQDRRTLLDIIARRSTDKKEAQKNGA